MIDWERVGELRGDFGEDDFAEIAVLFLTEVQEKLSEMAQRPSDNPSEDFHFLKGSAANLGFDGLTDACSAAERAGTAEYVSEVAKIFRDSRTQFLARTGIVMADAAVP